jgi:hypothetical protein
MQTFDMSRLPVELVVLVAERLGGTKEDNFSRLAMMATCRAWNLVLRRNAECWRAGKQAVVETIKYRRRPRKGLDVNFMTAHRFFRFSAEDVIEADVLPFGVATNDLAMVRRTRALWPAMTLAAVVEHRPRFVKNLIEGAGRGVLEEVLDWWGTEEFHRVLLQRLKSLPGQITWGVVKHLKDVLLFLRKTGVPVSAVLHRNKNLVANVVGMCGEEAVPVLRMLREWGMGIAHVRAGDREELWQELSLSADAIRELAGWGLAAGDAAGLETRVARSAAWEGRAEVLEVLVRDLKVAVPPEWALPVFRSTFLREGGEELLLMRAQAYPGLPASARESEKRDLLEDALRVGAGDNFQFLREKFRMTCDDLMDKTTRGLVVRFGCRRDQEDENGYVLAELMAHWGLGVLGWRGLAVVREMVARARGVERTQAEEFLDWKLGRGWELDLI